MKNIRGQKQFKILIFVLIAVITLGIGYAGITAINLVVNGTGSVTASQDNFKVHFTEAQAITGSTGAGGTSNIDEEDDTIATFGVSGLTKEGDYAEAAYTVENNSNSVGAEITLELTSSNTEYFKVTETVLDNKLQAGDTTTAKVKVEMIKTPVEENVSTSVTAKLIAKPIEDESATGGEQKEVIKPTPLVYTINGVEDIYINTDISSWSRQYSNFAEAKTEFGHPAAIAHETENGVVKASFVAFERNNTVYYLKGRIDESSSENKPVYEANVAELKKAFGSNWSDYCTDYSSGFYCSADGFNANASTSGGVDAGDSDWGCNVSSAGDAYCDS